MSLPAYHRSQGDAAAATVEGPTPPPQRVASAVSSSWQPLPRSFLRRRRVATTAAPPDSDAPRRTERMTWPGALPASRINLRTSPRVRFAAPPLRQPQLPASGHGPIEVLFNLNNGHLAYAGLVLLGLYAGLKDQMSGWSVVSKIIYLVLMILGASSLGAGLMAASSVASTSYTRRVSSVCSRLCTCLATFVFVFALACQMGSHGYIAGVVLGVAAVGYMLSVWIEGDPDAYDSYSWVRTAVRHLWQCFKWSARRGPLLP